MDKLLRIDMNTQTHSVESLGNLGGLGGRAMTSAIISREVPPQCHALGIHSKIVIAPGLLSGTTAPMSGRISVGCKSPLTGGIKEANSGGQAGQVLAKLGYAAIVIEGKPSDDKTYKILINKDGVKIEEDSSLKLMGNYELIDALRSQYGDKICCITIGPAGERKYNTATVAITDPELRPTRHAARGGAGAVMGSKGVKAIILDDTGTKRRQPKDPDNFKKAIRIFTEGVLKHPVSGEGLPALGTPFMVGPLNALGAFPTRNYSQAQFEGAEKLSGETMASMQAERGGNMTHACHHGCIIKCSGIYHDKDGNYVSKLPEYETIYAHGANCGIDDIDAVAQMDRMDDDYGVDTIEMGNAIAVAMDAGLAEFGDAQAAIEMVKEVGKGSPLGRILGNGAHITGEVFGIERVPAVKRQTMAGYDPRSCFGIGVTYATSTMGADHTAAFMVAPNLFNIGGSLDPHKPDGQVEACRNFQIATAAIDSTGMCLFVAFACLDQPETFQALVDMMNAFYGYKMNMEDFSAIGLSVLQNERTFNKDAGLTPADDRLPEFFKNEAVAPHYLTFDVEDEDLDKVFNF